jgi:hypothetical protein
MRVLPEDNTRRLEEGGKLETVFDKSEREAN